MALVNSSEFRRTAFRSALNMGLGVGVFSAFISLATPAQAQLRTGRSTDREFYSTDESSDSATVPKEQVRKPDATPRQSKPKNMKSEVVQASAHEVMSSHREPDRMSNAPSRPPKNQTAAVRKASAGPVQQASSGAVRHASGEVVRHETGEMTSSRVVQAGCKSCQSGIVHSHGPIAQGSSHAPSRIAHENYDEPSILSEAMYDPEAMVLGSNCDSCATMGTMGETGFLIQTPNIVGNVFGRMQIRVEAATFWPKGQNLPQLVTTRRPASNPATDGLIGSADTVNLFGGSEVLGNSTQGIRGELGSYFDDCGSHGFLLRFFDVGSNSLTYNSTPTSEPVVMRPFFSTANNAQSTIAINYPDSTSGSLNANISSDVYGGDILFRKLIMKDCATKLEFLAGYQTAKLADSLLIDSTTTALTNTPAPAGTISQLRDQFMTTNRFNGMALGLNGILRERCWSLSGMVKLGLGNMERSVDIRGSSMITVPGNPGSTNTTANGLHARNTNDGNYVSSTFVVTPETNLTLGYRITRGLEATVGYSYLGLPKVARVADQLDPQLASNLSNPPSGASTPSFSLRESNFSLHSLDYGLQWRY